MRDVYHRARPALLSVPAWRTRVLLWMAAGLTGAAAVGFAWIADKAQEAFARLYAFAPWWPWLAAPLGMAAISSITRAYFRGAEGSGIPQTIFALGSGAGGLSKQFMRLRVIVARVVLAAAALLCGASIGREGPTVHIGAAITQVFGRWMPSGDLRPRRHALILAGGAAGVAAAFNTPLAGVVFAIEELSRSFEERASGTTLTAVILAGVVAIGLSGNYSYFGEPHIYPDAHIVSFSILFVGLITGIAGGLFSRLTLAVSAGSQGFLGRWQRRFPILIAAACGIAIAALGSLTGGMTFGTGYTEARMALEGGATLPAMYAPARALATLLSFMSGVPAGLLAPSLSAGAGLGVVLSGIVGHAAGAEVAVLAMCGYLAGVTQAPLTSFVIVMEMTTGHEIVLPLMLVATIATMVSKLFSPPLYRTLAERQVGGTLAQEGMQAPVSK
jgi:chloride channel protein, CIC family